MNEARGRILLLEDEPALRRLVGAILAAAGYRVDAFEDGAEAVERFATALAGDERFHAAVLDLTLPGGMGGIEALQRIRALDPAIRAIVSSGHSSDDVLRRLEGLHPVRVLTKPYQAEELLAAIETPAPRAS